MKPDRNPLASHQIHLAPVLGLCVSERVERGIRNHPESGRIRISNYFCLGTYETPSSSAFSALRAVLAVLPALGDAGAPRLSLQRHRAALSCGRRLSY